MTPPRKCAWIGCEEEGTVLDNTAFPYCPEHAKKVAENRAALIERHQNRARQNG